MSPLASRVRVLMDAWGLRARQCNGLGGAPRNTLVKGGCTHVSTECLAGGGWVK